MWGIIFGIFFILSGCVGMLVTGSTELAMGGLALGGGLLLYGVATLIFHDAEDDPTEEPEEGAAPPLPAEQKEPSPAETEEPEPPAQAEQAEQAEPPAPPTVAAQDIRIANAPQEAPSPFKRGLRYLFTSDRHSGYKKAASCFIEGYESGDLNAGYMLCHCYKEGIGVPVKPAFVVQLAEYLVKRLYYPAYSHLAIAYREGRGVPMNLALATEYAKKFTEMCSSPLDGVHELIRYDALISLELHREEPDLRVLEQLARENERLSMLPSRYSLLAFPLLRDIRHSAHAREELQYLLNEGCHADDMGCFYLKGLLQCHGCQPLYPKDEKRGLEYLRLAAERLGTGGALLSYLRHTTDEAHACRTRELFWSACRWGISGVKGSDELNCYISLVSPEIPGAEPPGDGVDPYILLENKGERPLHSAVLRICSIDKMLDISIKLAPLAPGESVRIYPHEHRIKIGKRLYVEVSKDNLSSRMYLNLANPLRDFAAQS